MTAYDRRARTGDVRDITAEAELKARKKKLARKITGFTFTLIFSQIWWAQVVVWGLSYFGISSGLLGPLLLIAAAGGMFSSAVCLGMLLTAKRLMPDRAGE